MFDKLIVTKESELSDSFVYKRLLRRFVIRSDPI